MTGHKNAVRYYASPVRFQRRQYNRMFWAVGALHPALKKMKWAAPRMVAAHRNASEVVLQNLAFAESMNDRPGSYSDCKPSNSCP